MEIRTQVSMADKRPVVAASASGDRHSREGQWQTPRPERESLPSPRADDQDTLQSALRGRWVTDARHESERATVDEHVRTRQLRQRLEETYRAGAETAAGGWESRIDPLDLVV